MQVSEIKDDKAKTNILRAKVSEQQQTIINKLKLKMLNDTTAKSTINQYFTN